MKDEIKEILELNGDKYNVNLPKEVKEAFTCIDYELSVCSCELPKILDYITNLQEENDRLKVKLNCKEYFSSTMPENTEFVILTKENYDRQQKDIELELIDYKSRNEKAIEYIKQNSKCGGSFIDDKFVIEYIDEIFNGMELLNILNGGSNE